MLALALLPLSIPNTAYAQNREDDGAAAASDRLASARKLFAEGLKDEEKGNFAEALEKFRRVAKVRDTVPVRYRIASCLEGLGKLKEAMVAYQAAIDLGADGKDRDVVRAAKEHTGSLNERIPQVTLVLAPEARPKSQVAIDGQPVQPSELDKPIALDPGTHAITASSQGKMAFETRVTLPERARTTVVVPYVEPRDTSNGKVGSDTKDVKAEPQNAPADGAPHPIPTPAPESESNPGSGRRTAGWITAGAGAAFLVGAAVTLVMRQSDISSLEDACPDGRCPIARRSELESLHDGAQTKGTVAAVLAGVGVIGVGVGTYLLLSAPSSSRASQASARALNISGRVAPAGGQFVLTATF
ncbi:hypothetical protein LVJ94_44990 [Pendulispora rubella]|uniref:PEGA domain-containing protein n=1 Tax=Pendulispora rubella TaxID=2741070 RepID=A0ABZ2KZY3_9BACT